MLKIALTGGPATGKSLALETLKKSGITAVSSDEIVRSLQKPGSPLVRKIKKTFGSRFVSRSGILNRKSLRKFIFENPKARKRLEKLIHPQTILIIKRLLISFDKKKRKLCVVEVPLLFEAGLEKLFDINIVVSSKETDQIARLKKRDSINSEDAISMVRAQIPISKKVRLADIVVKNDSTRLKLRKDISKIVMKLKGGIDL